jgi:hypothetical protein
MFAGHGACESCHTDVFEVSPRVYTHVWGVSRVTVRWLSMRKTALRYSRQRSMSPSCVFAATRPTSQSRRPSRR